MQITDAMVDAALDGWLGRPGWRNLLSYATASRRYMRAALTAALAGAWRPIETAPKDEDILLGWWQTWPDRVWKQKVGWAAASNTCGHPQVSNAWFDGEATHWMPLPEPPIKEPTQ